MSSFGVVKQLDVIEDIGSRVIPSEIVFPPDALAFEQLKEAFCHALSWQLPRRLMLQRMSLALRKACQSLRHLEALTTSEVLMTPLGPNKFDAFGMKALFGRRFLFMDAQSLNVLRVARGAA